MRKCKALLLLLVVAMVGGMLFSCATDAEEITVKLKIVAGEDEICNTDIKLSYADPTVAMAVQEAVALYEIPVVWNEAGDSVKDVGEYLDHTDEDGTAHFWEYTINDVLPDNKKGGKANAQPIKDGDVIVYTYSTYVPDADDAE